MGRFQTVDGKGESDEEEGVMLVDDRRQPPLTIPS